MKVWCSILVLVAATVLLLPLEAMAQAPTVYCQRVDTNDMTASGVVWAGTTTDSDTDLDEMAAVISLYVSWTNPNPWTPASASAQATADGSCVAAQEEWVAVPQVEATGMTSISSTEPFASATASGAASTWFEPETAGVLRGTISFVASGSSDAQAAMSAVCADSYLNAIYLGSGTWRVTGVLQTSGGEVEVDDSGALQSYICQQEVEDPFPVATGASAQTTLPSGPGGQRMYNVDSEVYLEVTEY